MSPRMQFRGPARQRGAIGLMAAGTLALALGFTLLVIDTGRLYMEQRKLQRVADTAALEAVSRDGNCKSGQSATTYATQSATRNGFTVSADNTLIVSCGTLQTGAENLRAFVVDATKTAAVQVIVSRPVTTSIAAGIGALLSGAPVSLTTRLDATAVAAEPKITLAQLSIRSTLLSVDSARSNLLNPLFSTLLGGNVNLTVGGWDGLVKTDINLLKFMDQLAIELGVSAGNYTALLNTQGSVTKFIKAAANVVNLNGASAEVKTALTNLQVAATGASPIKLGDLLTLQTGTQEAGLDATVQLFQLIQGFVQLANKNSAVNAVLPVNLLGLAGVTTYIKVIQPPQFSAVGDPALAKVAPLGVNRIYVSTAQIRVLVAVDLSLIDDVMKAINLILKPIVALINTLLAPGCIFGDCTQTDLQLLPNGLSLDLGLEVGKGTSYVTDYSCATPTSKSLTATTEISTLQVKVGQINDAIWLSSSSATSLSPLALVDIGTQNCRSLSDCDPRIPFGGGGSEIMIDSPIAGKTEANYTFINPHEINVSPIPTHSVTISGVVGSLKSTLGGVDLIEHKPNFGSLLGALLGTLSSALSDVIGLLASAISGLLAPLVDPIVDSLLVNLGIDVNKVDVGFNLTCGEKGKAYLVI
ncbi:pilus assembly protein TadG-related protein [Pseudomonas sp. TNT2022 ID1044]|uniref:pilus assembly protein TadG-related protein n=1 Tax=Pseudomonas sp. TNT2022 ID1044 TaxID=2942636 RepID=UPI00235DCFAD|nr:pilus assembly protein TadG-related protein [Pseudomonas sp. TNT2022 ID1044]MDD0997771.1 pilus assembly protein TadG-related protein [Pseudomonas sp. TNT2022 ID1044]